MMSPMNPSSEPQMRERQKDYGRVKPHGLPHYFGSEHKVLYALNDGIHRHAFPKNNPEVNAGARRADYAQNRCDRKRNQLKVRHHIENPYKQPQHHTHREVDDKESDGKSTPTVQAITNCPLK